MSIRRNYNSDVVIICSVRSILIPCGSSKDLFIPVQNINQGKEMMSGLFFNKIITDWMA